MAIVAGVKIPDNERVEIALTRIYGVGRKIATDITTDLKIPPSMRARELNPDNIAQIRAYIEQNNITIEGDLRRTVQANKRHFMDIQSYRGLRHRQNLPVHGQRTKTNARTKRGRRQTVSGKRRVARGH